MADIFSRKERSRIMGRVKGRDTKPEIYVRSLIRKMGFRFRACQRNLPGNPDIVLQGERKVIFVNGCFWHGHKRCKRSKRPSTNKRFWNQKLDLNIKRDEKFTRKLRRDGWKVLVIWECEMRIPEQAANKLEKFLYEK